MATTAPAGWTDSTARHTHLFPDDGVELVCVDMESAARHQEGLFEGIVVPFNAPSEREPSRAPSSSNQVNVEDCDITRACPVPYHPRRGLQPNPWKREKPLPKARWIFGYPLFALEYRDRRVNSIRPLPGKSVPSDLAI
jgi:hypothetical protein